MSQKLFMYPGVAKRPYFSHSLLWWDTNPSLLHLRSFPNFFTHAHLSLLTNYDGERKVDDSFCALPLSLALSPSPLTIPFPQPIRPCPSYNVCTARWDGGMGGGSFGFRLAGRSVGNLSVRRPCVHTKPDNLLSSFVTRAPYPTGPREGWNLYLFC